ncbi:hypothetical protein D9611_013473 [Ephemerocybe angulata]|uniref:Uncharacterized protein n=1 Tax=Ephemerocybe angulata TaxID=980116 RepID=A0A8H5FA87_9AGAR|nr:hypothetical protein D9611_013473 [Tulosesus angulatus]
MSKPGTESAKQSKHRPAFERRDWRQRVGRMQREGFSHCGHELQRISSTLTLASLSPSLAFFLPIGVRLGLEASDGAGGYGKGLTDFEDEYTHTVYNTSAISGDT